MSNKNTRRGPTWVGYYERVTKTKRELEESIRNKYDKLDDLIDDIEEVEMEEESNDER